jgi:hypothetical protein
MSTTDIFKQVNCGLLLFYAWFFMASLFLNRQNCLVGIVHFVIPVISLLGYGGQPFNIAIAACCALSWWLFGYDNKKIVTLVLT